MHEAVAWQGYRWWLALQEVWAGGTMKQWHCCISYLIQVPICTVCKHNVQKNFWSIPQTRIYIDVGDSSVLPLLLFRYQCSLSGCYIINICVGHQVWSYEVWQFNSQKGPVKAKFDYLCTSGCCCFRNTLLVKLCTSWDNGATAGDSLENCFPE